MSSIKKFLNLVIKRTTTIPFNGVPYDKSKYLQQTSKLKIFKKYLHKYLFLLLKKQIYLQTKSIPLNKKCLWLYTGKRNIGDAIMDLSGRSLLKGHDIHLDLLTLPNLKEVFQGDDIFVNVFDDIKQVKKDQYDYIILSEFNHPSLRLKAKHFPKTMYACLFGFFYGPDRNQTLFSHHAINHIFNLNHNEEFITQNAKPYLFQNNISAITSTITRPYIALSIGGIDQDRSYQHWLEFLHLLDSKQESIQFPIRDIVLIGSSNGLKTSQEIINTRFQKITIHNYVSQLNILKSRDLISNAKLLIACDGGLMHVGHTTQTSSISIFRTQEPSEFRLTKNCHSIPIQSTGDVSAVPPALIFKTVLDVFNQKYV